MAREEKEPEAEGWAYKKQHSKVVRAQTLSQIS